MSLLNLPLELLVMITDHLSLAERFHLEEVCWHLRLTLRPYHRNLLQKLPWRIRLDFSRNRFHQTQIHAAWIKLGYFSNWDRLEKCPPIKPNQRHYVLIRTGFGGPMVKAICQYGARGKIHLDQGYLVRILDLQPEGISAKFTLGHIHGDIMTMEGKWRLLRDYKDGESQYHPTRGLIWRMDSHRLYEYLDT
jgi:hypothetical protein